MNVFQMDILAAEKIFYSGECQSLVIPTMDGSYGIQANHRNMIAAIVPGMLKFTDPQGKTGIAAVSEGLIKVENNRVLLLVDSIERPEEIDENRARKSAEQAKEIILQKKSLQVHHLAQAQMARAINRLRVKRQEDNQ